MEQIENGVSSKHPHEPEIPATLDSEGRCLVCLMLCEIDTLRADSFKEQRRTNHARAQFREERQRGESLASVCLRAAQRLEACERIIALNDGDITQWRQEEVEAMRKLIAANQNPGRVHWAAGSGSLPLDMRYIDFDDSVFSIQTCERGMFDNEKP